MTSTINAVLKFKSSFPTINFICLLVIATGLQLALAPSAHAAGLGKMRVLSPLGAPFNAEVEVTNIRPEEEGNIVVRIAAPDVFKQAGLDFNPALLSLRANLSADASNPKIILSSSSIMNEPLLELLLEMSWQSGRLVRQYTVLLDPVSSVNEAPVSMESIQAPIPQLAAQAPAAVASSNAPAPAIGSPAPPPASALGTSSNPKTSAKNYDVVNGDTLFGIASRLSAGDNYQVKALMAALLQNNPHAFINNNINRLKAGVVLNTDSNGLPTSAANNNLSLNQNRSNNNNAPSRAFSQYKQAAAQSVKPLLDKNTNSKTVRSSVKAESTAKTQASTDQLKVSGKAAVGNQSAANAAKSNEAQIAKDRAIAEEKSRIADLEKNIKKSVEIKNNVLVSPQAAKPESSKLGAPNAANPAIASSGGVSVVNPVAAATGMAVLNTPTADSKTTPVAPANTTSGNNAIASATPTATSQSASTTGNSDVKQTPPVVSAPNANANATLSEPSWYEGIDPMTLGGVGGIAALLGVWALYRRKKKNEAIEFTDSTFNPKDTQSSLSAGDGEQTVDTFNSVFVSNFSGANIPMESAEVDPVAEADVYMQYGRDMHAEDILVDALKQNPEHHPARLKLMELYASKGNQESLNTQFNALSALTQSAGSDWLTGKKIIDSSRGSVTQGLSGSGNQATIAPPSSFGNESAQPYRNTNSAIDNIKLSAPTMIGDIPFPMDDFKGNASQLSGVGASAGSSLNAQPGENLNAATKKTSSSPTGLNFDIQSPTILGRSTSNELPALAGIKSGTNGVADSLLDFKMSKINVALQDTPVSAKPDTSLRDISNANGKNDTILDKLSSHSGASLTPALETKLSLAQAYADIGDKEGARELLQEVVQAGHQTLSEQAKKALNRL